MSLIAGTRIGAYEVVSALGAGGMGEVYRARDTKLNRDVALKILPDAFARDPDRLLRFRREAQLLASLNHPNIGHIYGLEDGPSMALVLELVEGRTLADRIGAGVIPMSEVVPIASQIAAALEAAHEQGIMHRDLKPANVKVREDGTVKVLDFGLAKALSVEGDHPTASAMNSPTLTAHGTAIGMILGTAAYMAPEQAKGKAADKRADMWAFGVVLFEMVTGRRLFDAETVPETLAHVMMREIDLGQLPPSTPPRLRELIARCLVKDPKRRLRDIGEARIILEDPAASGFPSETSVAPAPSTPPSLVRRLWPIVVSCVFTAAIVGGLSRYFKPQSASLAVTRFALTLPADQRFEGFGRRALSFSPDGTQLVYQASALQLFVRSMTDGSTKPVPGTGGQSVRSATFSPDSQSLVFWVVNDRTLKTLALAGGAARTICPVAENPESITWTADGITFTQSNGIFRVAPGSDKPEALVTLKDREEAASPYVLPGGQYVLFTLATGGGPDRWEKAAIVAQSLASGERKTLIDGGTDARFVPTGHLVYALGGSLLAVRFDPRRLVVGRPTAVAEGVRRLGSIGQFTFSDSGSLAYLPGPLSGSAADVEIALTDRHGAVQALKIPAGPYTIPRVSPDGRRVAFESSDSKESLIYVYDLAGTTTMQRLTFGGNNRHPAWSGDGKRVAYQSDRGGDAGVWWQLADGSGPSERLTKPEGGDVHVPLSFTRDGQYLLVGTNRGSAHSVSLMSLANKQLTRLDTISSTTPTTATFSPNGHWIAYSTTEGGATTVYVQPFPATGAKFRLTAQAGDVPHHPRWSPDSTELFYNPRPSGFEAVRVITQPAFRFGSPVAVPKPVAVGLGPASSPTLYDVMPDGRFLGLLTPGAANPATNTPLVQVVLNWFEELKQRAK